MPTPIFARISFAFIFFLPKPPRGELKVLVTAVPESKGKSDDDTAPNLPKGMDESPSTPSSSVSDKAGRTFIVSLDFIAFTKETLPTTAVLILVRALFLGDVNTPPFENVSGRTVRLCIDGLDEAVVSPPARTASVSAPPFSPSRRLSPLEAGATARTPPRSLPIGILALLLSVALN
jgi:hypothetical protein